MTKSITDQTEKEQQRNKEAYRNYVDYWEDVLSTQYYSPITTGGEGATSLQDFRDNYKDDVKESFLSGLGPGGGFESFTYKTKAGEKEAWRFVEGAYTKEHISSLLEGEEKGDGKNKFKPSYTRKYKGGIESSFKTKVVKDLRDVNANEGLKTHKIKKSDYKKPKLPKSVRKYAEGSTPINTVSYTHLTLPTILLV